MAHEILGLVTAHWWIRLVPGLVLAHWEVKPVPGVSGCRVLGVLDFCLPSGEQGQVSRSGSGALGSQG